MNNETIKNNDPVQLKQMIIFLKAELTKFEQIVKEYENLNDVAAIESLEQENSQLMTEKNELTQKLKEMEKRNYISAIDTMKETKKDWLPLNKQLHEIEQLLSTHTETQQNKFTTLQQQMTDFYKEFSDYKEVMNELMDLIQKSSKQLYSEIEKISAAQNAEDKANQLLKEIDEKNQLIEGLQVELELLKKQQEVDRVTHSNDEQHISPEMLKQIEQELKEVVEKSLQYEQDLDEKLGIIHKLENKLEQLIVEVDYMDSETEREE